MIFKMNSTKNSNMPSGFQGRLQGKEEINFLERCSKFPDLIILPHPDSPQEGFEYIFERIQDPKSRKTPSMLKMRGLGGMLQFFRIFMKAQSA